MKKDKAYSKQDLNTDIIKNIGSLKVELESVFPNVTSLSVEGRIVYGILDDCLEIAETTYIDIYMYYFAMEHYNHPELFLAHYYTDYASTKINMIWERIINLLGIIYQVDYEEDNKNNSMKNIYRKLKKKTELDVEIRELLFKLMKDDNFRRIKEERNANEHDLTVHLGKEIDINRLKREYKYQQDKNEISFMEKEEYQEFTNEINYLVRKDKENIIPTLKYHLKMFNIVYKEILELLKEDSAFSNFKIQNISLYQYDYHKEMQSYLNYLQKNKINLCEYTQKLYFRALKIRDKITARTEFISRNPLYTWEKPPTKQILEYHIDAIYRLVECIRSLLIELQIVNEQDTGIIDDKLTDFYYYHNYVILRLYSCFEKIGKVLYTAWELNNYQGDKKTIKNTYLDDVIEFAKQEKLGDLKPAVQLNKIITSPEYILYERIRNKAYHGIKPNYILKGDEGGTFDIGIMFISDKLIEQILDLIEMIEEGEENSLKMTMWLKQQLLQKKGK